MDAGYLLRGVGAFHLLSDRLLTVILSKSLHNAVDPLPAGHAAACANNFD